MASKYLTSYSSKLKEKMKTQPMKKKGANTNESNPDGTCLWLSKHFAFDKTPTKLRPVIQYRSDMPGIIENTETTDCVSSVKDSFPETTNNNKRKLDLYQGKEKSTVQLKRCNTEQLFSDDNNEFILATSANLETMSKLQNLSQNKHVDDHVKELSQQNTSSLESGKQISSEICCKSSTGQEFNFTVNQEVKDYVRELYRRFSDANDKSPTSAEFKYLTSNALEMLLRYNDVALFKGKTKEILVKMVYEYMKLGCPPRCPKCKKGSLRFSNGKKRCGRRYFWCPGSTTDGKHFFGCNFKAQNEDIQRIPWKCP